MIVREFYMERTDGVKLYRTYSSLGLVIKQEQTGAEYSEAIDVEGAPYSYKETDQMILQENPDVSEAQDV